MFTKNTVVQPLVFKNKIEDVVYHSTEQKTETCKAFIKFNLNKSPEEIVIIRAAAFLKAHCICCKGVL